MDTAIRPRSATNFPLPHADLDSLGFRQQQIDRLIALIERHIAEGRYPGCQIALARHGKLALYKSFGNAVTEPKPQAAADDTLWLLYSNTKVVTAVALWALAERGLFSFSDRIADHVPEFAQERQGQHHGAADHHAPGRLPQRRRRQGRLGRPQAAARGGVRLPARMVARLEGALSRPDRPLDPGRADRSRHRQGFPRRHPRDRHRAAGPRPRALCRPAREPSSAAPPTCTSRSRPATASGPTPTPTRPTGARAARRAARATARRAPWPRSTR